MIAPAEIPVIHFRDALRRVGADPGEPDLAPEHERALGAWALEAYGAEKIDLKDAVVGFSQSEPEAAAFRVAETQSIKDEAAKVGSLSMRFGLGFAKSHVFVTGQCPVMKYHRGLMQAILADKVSIAKNVNATVISLEDAPQGYAEFDSGVAKKYVIDPHGVTGKVQAV